MKPLHHMSQVPVLPMLPRPTVARVDVSAEPVPSHRAEIQRRWIAEARLALGFDYDDAPARYRWLDDRTERDERNLAELGRWAMQLGAARCRQAADMATTRYEESKSRKDARRRVERSLRELRLFLTARQRQRKRRQTLLGQLAEVVDRYRMAHPGRASREIEAAVGELLTGIRSAARNPRG